MEFMQHFFQVKPRPGELLTGCLGQAGFLFGNAAGTVVVLDAYLGNACEKAFGFRRKIPAPVAPGALRADIVAATHAHMDHLDGDVLAALAPSAFFIGAADCEKEVIRAGFPPDPRRFLRPGESCRIRDVEFRAVYADHGELAPEAIGLYIVSDGVRIYVTGDTSCCPDKLAASLGGAPVDIMIVPVNPAFGNPGERNAAKMGRAFHPRVLIGAHFGMFDAHGGDPKLFLECCRDELEPETEAFAAAVGRMLLFSAAQGMKEV